MQVEELRHHEVVRLDVTRLDGMYRRLGHSAGEAVLGTAMEDLAGLLRQAEEAWREAELTALQLRAAEIAGVADRMGMTKLARVASDVTGLCWWYEEAALGAVMARLARLGERSLLAVWEAENMML